MTDPSVSQGVYFDGSVVPVLDIIGDNDFPEVQMFHDNMYNYSLGSVVSPRPQVPVSHWSPTESNVTIDSQYIFSFRTITLNYGT